jgi:hypothetical protein
MICPTCHGVTLYYNKLLGELHLCVDCGGSGIAHCCDGLTQGVIDMTRVEYWSDQETPDNTGWYICHYGTVDDMLAKSPEDVIGPYETEAEAKRVLAETTDIADRREREQKNVRTPTVASTLDAGIPTDNDEPEDYAHGDYDEKF